MALTERRLIVGYGAVITRLVLDSD